MDEKPKKSSIPTSEVIARITIKRPIYLRSLQGSEFNANNRVIDTKTPTDTRLAIKRATVSMNL